MKSHHILRNWSHSFLKKFINIRKISKKILYKDLYSYSIKLRILFANHFVLPRNSAFIVQILGQAVTNYFCRIFVTPYALFGYFCPLNSITNNLAPKTVFFVIAIGRNCWAIFRIRFFNKIIVQAANALDYYIRCARTRLDGL